MDEMVKIDQDLTVLTLSGLFCRVLFLTKDTQLQMVDIKRGMQLHSLTSRREMSWFGKDITKKQEKCLDIMLN